VVCLSNKPWLAAGTAYFGYLHKLRRDIAQLERAHGCTRVRAASRKTESVAGHQRPARFQPRARLP
jgi:hypothetical protein